MSLTKEKEVRLLTLLKEGKCQKDIAKRLKLATSVVNYHVQKYLKLGLLEEIKDEFGGETSPKLYSLTNEGESYLKRLNSTIDSTFSLGGEEKGEKPQKETRPRWLLHHAQWKYPIITDHPIKMSMEVQLNNWKALYDEWKHCTIQKTPSHVIIHIKQITGDNAYELELRSRNISDTMINLYESAYGMEFGRPIRVGKPHFVDLWEDETWEEFKKYVSVETPSAIIDTTPPKAKEFKSVESASNYANLGDNVTKLMGKVANLEQDMGEQKEVLIQIRNLLNSYFESQKYQKLPETDEKRDVT